MPSVLFYLFAAITLLFGVGVVVARNPVASALSLVCSFTGLAALFISLDAYFIGTLQILVYAGAVMVLFLFIIMLLDIKAAEGRQTNYATAVGGLLLAVLFTVQIAMVLGDFKEGNKTLADQTLNLGAAASKTSLNTIKDELAEGTLPDAKLMGFTLFDKYPFQLQVVGLLLLAGTVGVVVLSKRDRGGKEEVS
ncbi:MAG: NADH-quinone oxidoreductase subunit J [Verrucomicrobiaceae bacterium]|nr:NADH-quinone oxidoreductase subunit J [Verrucomicrobiaceae bacterium]